MRSFLLFMLFFAFGFALFAQQGTLTGIVKDRQSDEHMPYVSIIVKSNNSGVVTDSVGFFKLSNLNSNGDTLLITYVGYLPVAFVVPAFKDSLVVSIKMDFAPINKEAVVKVKYNRALWFWNRIMKHKEVHNISNYENYQYEIYNKLELDLNNVHKEKLGNVKLLKPFNFILNNIDSAEGKAFLPLFLTETISDYYWQHSPKRVREIIKASKTNGIENESVTKFLGGMYQNINIYQNYIPVFDKQFASPFHENGDYYYNFKLQDTQYLGGKRLVHLSFSPKRKGENTFEGDCWVVDSVYAIQKITLRPSGDANVNFVEKLTLIQEFSLVNDSIWFVSKDKFVADISPLGKSKSGLKGRKTTTYRNVVINDSIVAVALKENKKTEEVIVLPDSENKIETFWDTSRHELLSKNELAIYKMIDTIQTLPAFKKYSNAIMFIGTGYKYIGNYTIGPWYNWISGNNWEGTRVRFDLATNADFSKKFYLHSYLAYGFGDQKLKGKGEVFYLPKKDPRMYFYASYTKDLDNGQQYYDEISTDNIFALAIRKANVPLKFQSVEEKRFEFYKATNKGLSVKLEVTSKQFTPLLNLPDKSFFENNIPGQALNNFETTIKIRYAYLERFLENNFFRSSLGSDLPIVEFRYSKGFAGVLQSSYNYNKISASVSDYMNVPPFGNIYYNFFAGKIYGTLPYPLLEIHPGNEIYYYNKYAFNMMNRFEFISDKYAGFNIEHNIGNGLFRFLPLTRKLKFRQFWTAKGVVGSLSDANQNLNFVGTQNFKSLNNKAYIEVGTGVDNILKVLRLDFVWRVSPNSLSGSKETIKRFGIFGSFRVAF